MRPITNLELFAIFVIVAVWMPMILGFVVAAVKSRHIDGIDSGDDNTQRTPTRIVLRDLDTGCTGFSGENND